MNAHKQIQQLEASLAVKKAEMGTDLIDQLTPKERTLLSSLNPEITQLKERLVKCKTARMEV